jgi:hypothetical protein
MINEVSTRDVFVGRTAEKGRIYLNFAYRPNMPVVVSGHHIPYRCREADNAGQMVYRVSEITDPAKGWTVEELEWVRETWDKYHLNSSDRVPADVAEKFRALVDRLR